MIVGYCVLFVQALCGVAFILTLIVFGILDGEYASRDGG